jgi:hypothetical protein
VIEMLLQADRLLTMDMVEQADAIYRRVAEQDPRNAIAVVGMARCALARGEDHEAYRLAARALDIDPENDMARRMTLRMAEVLTYRGETLPDITAAATPVDPPAAAPAAPAPAPIIESAAAAPDTTTMSDEEFWAEAARRGREHPTNEVSVVVASPRPTAAAAPSRSWLDRIRGR